MILSRYTPGKSALSKPWPVLLGMIERFSRIERIPTLTGWVNNYPAGVGWIEAEKEDFWSR